MNSYGTHNTQGSEGNLKQGDFPKSRTSILHNKTENSINKSRSQAHTHRMDRIDDNKFNSYINHIVTDQISRPINSHTGGDKPK
jgi:hypothetical protein